MNLKKIIQRLLVFFVGVPVVLCSIIFVPWYNHAFLNILIIIASVIGALELRNMLAHKMKVSSKILTGILGGIFPLFSTITSVFQLHFLNEYFYFIFVVFFLVISIIEIFFVKDLSFSESIEKILSSFFTMFYPGFFLSFLCKMTEFKHSSELISIFLLMVFASDSVAWLFGMLFGKNNRGFIKVSPNKSILGFIGALVGSICAGLIGYYFVNFYKFQPNGLRNICIIAIVIAFMAILGDLFESVLKRSGSTKDSGGIIPGRGGLLDSIDSILLAAPCFLFLASIFFINL